MNKEEIKISNRMVANIYSILDSDEKICDLIRRSKRNLEDYPQNIKFLILNDIISDYVLDKLINKGYDNLSDFEKTKVKRYCDNLSNFLLENRSTEFYNNPIFSLSDKDLLKLFGSNKLDIIKKIRIKNKKESIEIYKKYMNPVTRNLISKQEFDKMIDFFTLRVVHSESDVYALFMQKELLKEILKDERASKSLKAKNFILQYLLCVENQKRKLDAKVYLCDSFLGNKIFDCQVKDKYIGLNSAYLINTPLDKVDVSLLKRYDNMPLGYREGYGIPFAKVLQLFYSAIYQISNANKILDPKEWELYGWKEVINFYREFAPQHLNDSKQKML